jgi:hypothetical protein
VETKRRGPLDWTLGIRGRGSFEKKNKITNGRWFIVKLVHLSP